MLGCGLGAMVVWHVTVHPPFSPTPHSTTVRDIDDGADHRATQAAMAVLAIPLSDRRRVCATLAALLHLSTVEFEPPPPTHSQSKKEKGATAATGGGGGDDEREGSSVCPLSEPALQLGASLLGLASHTALASVLTRVRVAVRGEVTYRLLSPAAAADTRDALVKQVGSGVG